MAAMRYRLFVLAGAVLPWLPLAAQNNPQATSAAASQSVQRSEVKAAASLPKIDPAKEADIRKLLDLVGTKAVMQQTIDRMSENIRPLMTNSLPPGEYRDKLINIFFQKFQSRLDLQQMLDLIVPVYDKYFSAEEIKELVTYYESPLGRKASSTVPKIMAEAGDAGREWGRQLGKQCMEEVLAENPDLRQALEAAAAKNKQP